MGADGVEGSHPRDGRRFAVRSAALAGLLALFALGLRFVKIGELNADEGFYLLAARLVADGLVPYRDFGITQPPGMPWVYSLLLRVFGWDLAGIRSAGLFLVVLTAAAGLVWSARQKNGVVAAIYLILLLSSPGWLAFAVKGKTYGLAGLCVLAGAIAILGRGTPGLRLSMLLVAAAAGVLTRLPTLAFFAVGWIALLMQIPSWKARAWSVVTAGILAVAAIGIGSHGALEEARFWTVTYHRLGVAPHAAAIRWGALMDLAPGCPAGLGIAGVLAIRARRTPLIVAWAAVVVAIIANVGASRGYGEYAAPFIPAGALVVALAVEPLVGSRRSWRRRLLVAAAAAGVVGLGWMRPPETNAGVLPASRDAAAFLADSVPAGKWVVASMPEIPVGARRGIPVELAMGKFSLTESLAPDQAARLHMVTPARLFDLLENPDCGAVVLSTAWNWNFAWSVPELNFTSQAVRDEFDRRVASRFELAFTSPHYLVYLPRQSDKGGGRH